MIDEQKTFKTFGYYSYDVSREKKVVAHCTKCDTDRIIGKGCAINSKICAKCQRIEQCKIIANINRIGRKHTEETKQKIGASNAISQKKGELSPFYNRIITEAHKQKIRDSNISRIWTDESKEKARNAKLGKKLSDEHRDKLSFQNKLRSGIKNHNYGKIAQHGRGEYYIKKDGSKKWMRSFWEIQVAKYLDSKEYTWEYEPEAFPIKYVFDNINKDGTYRPDFYIKELDEYWEIKGWWRDDAKEKFMAFNTQYQNLNIKLYQKEELEKLGLYLRRPKNKINDKNKIN